MSLKHTSNTDGIISTPKSVHLSPSQAVMIAYFNQKPGKFINTFEFIRDGQFNPASTICKLKKKGALFETVYDVDEYDFIHEYKYGSRIAHYKLIGWSI